MERGIDWFHIVDIPQIVTWISKNDLVFTCGYAFSSVPEVMDGLIENLSKKGASGLIIATDLYLQEVPQDMIEAANRLNFPLISFDAENRFREVTRQLSEALLGSTYRFAQKYDFWLQKTINVILNEKMPLYNLIKMMKKSLNSDVLLLDGLGRLLISGQVLGQYDDFLKHFRQNDMNRIANNSGEAIIGCFKKSYFFYRIHFNERVVFLVILDNIEKFNQEEVVLFRSIVVTIAALINNENVLKQSVLSAQLPIMESLLSGHYASDELLKLRINEQGWDLTVNHIIVVCEVTNFDKYIVANRLHEKEIDKLKKEMSENLITMLKEVQGVYPVLQDDLSFTTMYRLQTNTSEANIIKNLQDFIEYFKDTYSLHVVIGISTIVKDTGEFKNRLDEAKETVEIIKMMKSMPLAKYDQIGLDIIVSKILLDSEIRQTYLTKIKNLLAYDARYKSDLLYTLRTFINNRGSYAKTAKSLDVHRNTIKYRLQKIEEVMEVSFASSNTFLNMSILLKVYDMQDK